MESEGNYDLFVQSNVIIKQEINEMTIKQEEIHIKTEDFTTSSAELNNENEEDSKRFACNVCEYKTNHTDRFKAHVRSHTGEKPWKCTFCNYSSAEKCNLIKHVRTHTGEKPYKCTICSYSAVTRFRLTQHIKTHTGERPWKCSFCNYRCADNSTLNRHLRQHTGEERYKCSICSRVFARNYGLTRHLKTHTSEKSFRCDNKSNNTAKARTKSQVIGHSKNIHANNKFIKESELNLYLGESIKKEPLIFGMSETNTADIYGNSSNTISITDSKEQAVYLEVKLYQSSVSNEEGVGQYGTVKKEEL